MINFFDIKNDNYSLNYTYRGLLSMPEILTINETSITKWGLKGNFANEINEWEKLIT